MKVQHIEIMSPLANPLEHGTYAMRPVNRWKGDYLRVPRRRRAGYLKCAAALAMISPPQCGNTRRRSEHASASRSPRSHETMAKLIIELAKNGERDPKKLCEDALKLLGK